jgi:hypothetical protein
VQNVVQRDDTDSKKIDKRTILPSTFTGSPCYLAQNYQDAMVLSRYFGNLDLFITFIANPNWLEIKKLLEEIPKQRLENRPEIEVQVFKIKLDDMMYDILHKKIFGQVNSCMYFFFFSHVIISITFKYKLSYSIYNHNLICLLFYIT